MDLFLQSSLRHRFEISAYCFMPDHVHAIVSGLAGTSDVYRFVHHAKQVSAFRVRQAFGLRLWQPSFFDRTLRADEDTWPVVRYVINNPVRAGLAASPGDYPFWGSQMYTREEILEFVGRGPRA